MTVLAKIRRRPLNDWALLARVFLLVAGLRVALRCVPLRSLRRLLGRWDHGPAPDRRGGDLPDRVRWAMALARTALPGTTCLPEALATHLVLSRSGWPARLQIGVARSEGGAFEAHAWVECEGKVVAGDRRDLSRYTILEGSEGAVIGPA